MSQNLERRDELLDAAASALENGMIPLSMEWLVENDVTADECFDTAHTIAIAIRMMLLPVIGEVLVGMTSAATDEGATPPRARE